MTTSGEALYKLLFKGEFLFLPLVNFREITECNLAITVIVFFAHFLIVQVLLIHCIWPTTGWYSKADFLSLELHINRHRVGMGIII